MLFAVEQVGFDQGEVTVVEQGLFDGILYLFDGGGAEAMFVGDFADDLFGEGVRGFAVGRLDGAHGLEDGLFDFLGLENRDGAVALDDPVGCVAAVHLLRMVLRLIMAACGDG